MSVFFVLVGVSFAGILAVFWLLKSEDKPSLRDFGAPVTTAEPTLEKPSLFAGVIAKFRKVEKSSEENVMEEIPWPSVTDFSERPFGAGSGKQKSVPIAQEVNLSADEGKKIEEEIDFAAKIEEWQEKYERLDKLFNEKSTALEKAEESLKNELNNRKEFNKIKDILEKDLREAKDRARNVQLELNAAKTEAEESKKRIDQLEDKVTKMEIVSAPPVPETPPQVTPIESSGVAPELKGDGSKATGAANPSSVIPQEGESNRSEKPTEPEGKPQDAQDKPVSEGQTNQKDEQKKEI